MELAKRYLQNAKEFLKKAGYDRRVGSYVDVKYVSIASGAAYLAALESIKALLMAKKGWSSEEVEKKAKDIASYRRLLKELPLGKDRDVLLGLLRDAYQILHLGGYYRELRNKKAIDAGFESVAKIIKIVERHVSTG